VIHWLVQSLDDCPEIVNGVAAPAWLGEVEQARLSTFKVEKRRRDWLLGRWTAKNLVQRYLAAQGESVALARIVIQADADGAPYVARGEGQGTPPRPDWGGSLPRGDTVERIPLSLSISHSHGTAFCGLAALGGQDLTQRRGGAEARQLRPSLGCDIELVEPREASFVSSFFTSEEMESVAVAGESRDLLVTAIWCGKEAVLKALREGLRIDTRRLTCRFEASAVAPQEWTPMTVAVDGELAARFPGRWSGWWRVADRFVLTMALLE
jgi:4'-phosphopantetheinyl transferase